MCSDDPQLTDRPRGVFTARVTLNEPLCQDHWRMVLRLPAFPPSRPGQFIQLQCRPLEAPQTAAAVDWPEGQPPKFTQPELLGREPMLRRPFSLAGRRDGTEGAELELLYHAMGTGSRWLARQEAGAEVSLIGPLGNGLPVVESKPRAILVGGGIGIPPMIYHARTLAEAGKNTVAFAGARSRHLLPLPAGSAEPTQEGRPTMCSQPFEAVGVETVITTDDGTLGFAGTATDAVVQWLRDESVAPEELVAFGCGPEPMMRALGNLCIDLGVECYLSLERHMACGMGTCQSCIVKVRDETAEQGWRFKLCCTHGPVFEARELLW